MRNLSGTMILFISMKVFCKELFFVKPIILHLFPYLNALWNIYIRGHFWLHGWGEFLNISISSTRSLELPWFLKVLVSRQIGVWILKDTTTITFSWECRVCYSHPTTEFCYVPTIFVHQQSHNSRLNRDGVHLAIISPQSLLVLIVLWQRYFWNILNLVKLSYLTASKE